MPSFAENLAWAIESWAIIQIRGRQIGICFFSLHEGFARRLAEMFPARTRRGPHRPGYPPRKVSVLATDPEKYPTAWCVSLGVLDLRAVLVLARPHLCEHHQHLADVILEIGQGAERHAKLAGMARRRLRRMVDVETHVDNSGAQNQFRGAKKLLATARAMCPVPRNAWPETSTPKDPELVLV